MQNISTKDYRRIAGAKSHANGANFEKIIDAACKYYAGENIALIEKTPEPFRITKSLGTGRFAGHFTKQAQPDYKGVLFGGRCIVFEAKHSDSGQIAQNRLTVEQSEILEKYSNLGAKCFVLVSIGFADFYRVPWEVWREMKGIFKHKHMKQSELERYRIPLAQGVLRFLDDDI